MWVAFAFDIILTRTVHILTTNKLVKLTTLWKLGPGLQHHSSMWSTFLLKSTDIFLIYQQKHVVILIRSTSQRRFLWVPLTCFHGVMRKNFVWYSLLPGAMWHTLKKYCDTLSYLELFGMLWKNIMWYSLLSGTMWHALIQSRYSKVMCQQQNIFRVTHTWHFIKQHKWNQMSIYIKAESHKAKMALQKSTWTVNTQFSLCLWSAHSLFAYFAYSIWRYCSLSENSKYPVQLNP